MIKHARRAAIGNVVLAVLLLVGGLIGFLKAGSLMSLIMSFVLANLLFLSLIAIYKSASIMKLRWVYYVAALVCVFLLVFFTIRLLNGAGLMPAAIILPAAAADLVLNILFLHEASSQK